MPGSARKLVEGNDLAEVRQFYNDFYSQGGWSPSVQRERARVAKVVAATGWQSEDRVLELGCGAGLQAMLLSEHDLRVTAIDQSDEGIRLAKRRAAELARSRGLRGDHGPRFERQDLTKWKPMFRNWDGIYCRGLSLYHYELAGENKLGHNIDELTERFVGWLKPGGAFVLQICTDFSGRRPPDHVHENTLDDYLEHFDRRGMNVDAVTDWDGRRLTSNEQARKVGRNGVVVIARCPPTLHARRARRR